MANKKLAEVQSEKFPSDAASLRGSLEENSLEEVVEVLSEIQSNPTVGKEAVVSEKLRIEKKASMSSEKLSRDGNRLSEDIVEEKCVSRVGKKNICREERRIFVKEERELSRDNENILIKEEKDKSLSQNDTKIEDRTKEVRNMRIRVVDTWTRRHPKCPDL